MTTEVVKQHALDRLMSHPTGGFLSEVWHGPPSWRRKHLEGLYLGPQHRPCAISGAPDRSEAWRSAARGMLRAGVSLLRAPLSRSPLNSSSGSGKIMVDLFSEAISVTVCR